MHEPVPDAREVKVRHFERNNAWSLWAQCFNRPMCWMVCATVELSRSGGSFDSRICNGYPKYRLPKHVYRGVVWMREEWSGLDVARHGEMPHHLVKAQSTAKQRNVGRG